MSTDSATASGIDTSNSEKGNATISASRITDAASPYVAKAKGFAKERPWAFAALAGVLGLATLGTLRGRGNKS